jgi:hypothetical protein
MITSTLFNYRLCAEATSFEDKSEENDGLLLRFNLTYEE